MENVETTSEDPEVRKKYADHIKNILRPLAEHEFPKPLFDDNASVFSTLSEPFSDLDESYILLDQRKKVWYQYPI